MVINMNKNDKCGIAPLGDLDVQEIDKELLMKALSKPENQEKILKINQEIMKSLNGESSSIIFETANVDKSGKVKRPQVKIDNNFEE